MPYRFVRILVILLLPGVAALGQATAPATPVNTVLLPNRITLHYVSAGTGEPMVFVHGALTDYTYWNSELTYFSKFYHVIAYSRRYNYPNHNPARPGYSSKSDAADLAFLITALKLGKVIVVGDAEGAMAALYLAISHPEMVDKLILSEPPAVSLLDNLAGANAVKGKKIKKEMIQKMVIPMRRQFKDGNTEEGIKIFTDDVSHKRGAWKKMSRTDKDEALRNSYEWEVLLPQGVFFPPLDKKALSHIQTPVLLLSGGKSYHFINLTDAELHRIIPNNSRVILKNADHRLWRRHANECRQSTIRFLKEKVVSSQ